MPHPLATLVQAIHLPSAASPFLLLTAESDGTVSLHLYTRAGDVLLVWTGEMDVLPDDSDETASLAEAITEGYLHLDLRRKAPHDATNVSLHILPPGQTPVVVALSASPADAAGPRLVDACLALLERPKASDASEVRNLRAEIAAKDAEIAHLTARLASAKATVARTSTAESKKKQMASPQKKLPANASALQPNQKRRKVVEDEFAGSSGDEDEDDEGE